MTGLASQVTDSGTSIVVVILLAVVTSSALAAGITGLLNRRKISSEAENIQAQTSELVWNRVKSELKAMQEQIDALRKTNDVQQDRLDTVGPMLRDTARRLRIAIAHIERMYDGWPRDLKPAPAIPHELVEDLPTTIVEDPTIPPDPRPGPGGPEH